MKCTHDQKRSRSSIAPVHQRSVVSRSSQRGVLRSSVPAVTVRWRPNAADAGDDRRRGVRHEAPACAPAGANSTLRPPKGPQKI